MNVLIEKIKFLKSDEIFYILNWNDLRLEWPTATDYIFDIFKLFL